MESISGRVTHSKTGTEVFKICCENLTEEDFKVFTRSELLLWLHLKCFLQSKRKISFPDIENLYSLSIQDQEEMKKKLDEADMETQKFACVSGSSKHCEVFIHYLSRNEEPCKNCSKNISKGELCISIFDDSQNNEVIHSWSHADCFIKQKQKSRFLADSISHDTWFYQFETSRQPMIEKSRRTRGSWIQT
ncbi:unnamed protein product [Larinioides sclopetarius]|uniref:PARP-type domain-containing protein n=1 Tax=Larinioides sclopetarius TaxID=280406 RepID=A0AAV2AW69_9ARAC